jgi:hypothetical protein
VLPPGEHKTQKVVVGDQTGVVQCFSLRKGELALAFKSLPCAHRVSSLCLGRGAKQRDKIFVAAGNTVRHTRPLAAAGVLGGCGAWCCPATSRLPWAAQGLSAAGGLAAAPATSSDCVPPLVISCPRAAAPVQAVSLHVTGVCRSSHPSSSGRVKRVQPCVQSMFKAWRACTCARRWPA